MVDKEALKRLALMGRDRWFKISSAKLAKEMNTSIQTAARKLKELVDLKLIDRNIVKNGQYVKINNRGFDILRKEYLDYINIFESLNDPIVIKGEVFTGLGEGQYYLSQEGYKKQIKEILGFDPYPGTLNLKIYGDEILKRKELNGVDGIIIKPFKSEERSFGGGICYKATIKKDGDLVEGAIIRPERTHHPEDLLELIASINLRKRLNLKDGDIVEVIYDKRRDRRY
ncbi:MAG: DUF120 domain-containing protein [Candidatus Methanoliparum thermophilum]|uniref:Riboflavin kinase n=2 Tax=Candidatus Methanoliparum TaxID=2545692 RepID=A0A520KU96_METT2|nr:MAG: DUF120 domain-containing protein [Candidatus Methanoliparum thermophilum]